MRQHSALSSRQAAASQHSLQLAVTQPRSLRRQSVYPTPTQQCYPQPAGHAGRAPGTRLAVAVVAEPAAESEGGVQDRELTVEASESYLAYAMSVIVGRALPDVRDGLKPVHRRILYAMHDLGLTHNKPFKKCARVVGEVLGKYHPHGDQAVYDTLVRLAQDFTMRTALISGHGNFGSLDQDPAAAMRYTECRLQSVTSDMLLSDLDQDVVDWAPTFDASQDEPLVLPAKLPHLLINGSSGIAVGIATKIPPHNMREVTEALAALIRNPDISTEELMAHIPGPDFPTGNIVEVGSGLLELYSEGRGHVTVKAKIDVEEGEEGGRRRRGASGERCLVIKDTPYQTSKSALVEAIAKLVETKVLEGISAVRDESDRTVGTRVVIELKSGVSAEAVREALYKHTRLSSRFSAHIVALVDGRPQQLSLKDCLRHFLDFRCEVVRRRARHDQSVTTRKLSQVEGYLLAAASMETVIQVIRGAEDGASAKAELSTQLGLTAEQAEAVLSLPLRRLTRMSVAELEEDKNKLTTRLSDLSALLSSESAVLARVEEEARAVADKHSSPRRSTLVQEQESTGGENGSGAPVIQLGKPVILSASSKGFIQKLHFPSTLKGRGMPRPALRAGDCVRTACVSRDPGQALAINKGGLAYIIKTASVPQQAKGTYGASLAQLVGDQAKGPVVALVDLSELQQQHAAAAKRSSRKSSSAAQSTSTSQALDPFPQAHEDDDTETDPTHIETDEAGTDEASTSTAASEHQGPSLVIVTKKGMIKRLIPPMRVANKAGSAVIKFPSAGDEVLWAGVVQLRDLVAIARQDGRVLVMEAHSIRLAGRSSQGVKGITLAEGDEVVGATVIPDKLMTDESEDAWLALITEEGKGKRIPVSHFRVGGRGQVGQSALKTNGTTDRVAGLALIRGSSDELHVKTEQEDRAYVDGAGLKEAAHSHKPGKAVAVKDGDRVVSVAALPWGELYETMVASSAGSE